MTTPASASGTGGAWLNQSYPVNNAQSLLNFSGFHAAAQTTVTPPAAGILQPTATLGGSGPYAGNPVFPIAQFNSYETWVGAYANNGTATGVILTVEFLWFDTLQDQIPIDHIKFDCPVGVTAATLINTVGKGSMRGQFMMVLLTTKTATFTTNVQMTLTGIMRNYTSDDWRSDGGLTSSAAGFQSNLAIAWTNEICILDGAGGNGISVPASGSVNTNCFLYSGQAFVHTENTIAAGTLVCYLQDDAGHNIAGLHPGEQGSADEVLLLPRILITVLVVNNSASAAGTVKLSIIADRI